eukprot:352886_1
MVRVSTSRPRHAAARTPRRVNRMRPATHVGDIPNTSAQNNVSYWGPGTCTKEDNMTGLSKTADGYYETAIVKSAGTDSIYANVQKGDSLVPLGPAKGKDISHIIWCKGTPPKTPCAPTDVITGCTATTGSESQIASCTPVPVSANQSLISSCSATPTTVSES